MKKAIILWACMALAIVMPLSAIGNNIELCTANAVTSLYGYEVSGDITVSIDAARDDRHLIIDIDGEAVLTLEGNDVDIFSDAMDKYVRWRNEARANRHQIEKQIVDPYAVPCLKKNIIMDDEEGLAIVIMYIHYITEQKDHMLLIGTGMLGSLSSDSRLVYLIDYDNAMKIKNGITDSAIKEKRAEHSKKQKINDLYK